MSDPNLQSRSLANVAETEKIRRLLGGVTRRKRKGAAAEPAAPPEPFPDLTAPEAAFVAESIGVIVESPLEREPAFESPAAAEVAELTRADEGPRGSGTVDESELPPVERPIGALSFGEILARINWDNRPERMQPMPLIGIAGYADTVEAVLSALDWDDE